MRDSGRFDHLRASALDLLDAGNSATAVAQVLGVPAALVARWRSEPAARGAATAPVATPDAAVSTQRSRTGAIHFRTTLTLTQSLVLGLRDYLFLVLGFADLIGDFVSAARHPAFAIANLVLLVVFGGVLVSWLGVSRTLLILGPDEATVPGLLGRRSIAYSDLRDYWLVSDVRGHDDHEVEGRRLTLHSRRAGVRPIEIFIDDDVAIDPALIERLDQVKAANLGVGPLTPMGSIPRV